MARRGGGGSRPSGGGGLFGGRSKSAAKPTPPPARRQSTSAAPPPARQPQQQAPPPAQPQAAAPSGGGGMLSGLAGTVMQGMAFGTGSAIAHRAVDAVAGPRQVEHVHSGSEAPAAAPASNDSYASPAAASGACGDEYKQFQQCISDNSGQLASCNFYYDVLNQCQQNTGDNQKWA